MRKRIARSSSKSEKITLKLIIYRSLAFNIFKYYIFPKPVRKTATLLLFKKI